jgi:hypothetical protein
MVGLLTEHLVAPQGQQLLLSVGIGIGRTVCQCGAVTLSAAMAVRVNRVILTNFVH